MRWSGTLLLVLFAGWELLCFADNARRLSDEPPLARAYTWPGRWQMFTHRAGTQHEYELWGHFDGVRAPLPTGEWLDARWETGERWVRAAQSERALAPFLDYACERSGADAVWLEERRWRRVPRTAAQFEVDADVTLGRSHLCR